MDSLEVCARLRMNASNTMASILQAQPQFENQVLSQPNLLKLESRGGTVWVGFAALLVSQAVSDRKRGNNCSRQATIGVNICHIYGGFLTKKP